MTVTHEEAWTYVNRQISAETGGPYVVPPFMKKAEETHEDDERPGLPEPGLASGEETSTHAQDTTMQPITITNAAYATARITETDALAMLEFHGIDTQVLDDKIQALSVWADKHASGGIGSEWVDVVCRRDWIRAFLGY